jgi:hypothetical protein
MVDAAEPVGSAL